MANSIFVGNGGQSGGALIIESSVFDSNEAVCGGAIKVSGSSSISITNSKFSNNIGVYGGVINIEHSEASIAWSLSS